MVAIRQRDLSVTQIATILRFRLTHALLNGDVDPRPVEERGAEHEWWFPGQPDDVHLIAGAAATGQILCYMAFATLADARPEQTLFSQDRPRFEVEDVFGTKAFHSVSELRNAPLTSIVEGRRFFRSRAVRPTSELAVRAPVELGVAFYRVLVDALSPSVTAILGDVEAIGAQANLRYFDLPHVNFEQATPVSVTPYPAAVREVSAYPVVLLIEQMRRAESRVRAIEAALELPGHTGVQALFALRGAPGRKKGVA
jgi:hypothetical protein